MAISIFLNPLELIYVSSCGSKSPFRKTVFFNLQINCLLSTDSMSGTVLAAGETDRVPAFEELGLMRWCPPPRATVIHCSKYKARDKHGVVRRPHLNTEEGTCAPGSAKCLAETKALVNRASRLSGC